MDRCSFTIYFCFCGSFENRGGNSMGAWIGTTSPVDEGMPEFKQCLRDLRDGHFPEALTHSRRALGLAPRNPFYLSYTGLLAALAEKRFDRAEVLCREAIGVRSNHAQLYLNLAEVYRQEGRTTDAISALEQGLSSVGQDFRLRRALEKIGLRRSPVFPFLGRHHAINRLLGRWRHKFSGPPRLIPRPLLD
jgi:tetratricopeptide (TPR) repeat protein